MVCSSNFSVISGEAVGNSHTDYTICATVPPHCGHIVCTMVGIKSASCSHSFAHWFAQFEHTVRTLGGGVQGIFPWPTFIAATAAINIVGHYVFSDGAP